jgi:succinyl-CoA synthetase alpha subunit
MWLLPEQVEEILWLLANRIRQPVVACVVGRTAPPFARMGHPSTLFVRDARSHSRKVEWLRAAGAAITESSRDVAALAARALGAARRTA